MPNPENSPLATETSAESLVSELVMPTPDENITAQPALPPAHSAKPKTPQLDSKGRPWDASKHSSPPRLSKTGNWVGVGAGRPSKAVKAKVQHVDAGQSEIIDDEAQAEPCEQLTDASGNATDKYDLAAETYCRVFYSIATGVISDEWQPDDKGEHDAMKGALKAYLVSKGDIDIPPGAALAIAVAGYGFKRASRPTTSAKFKAWFSSIKSRITGK